MNKNLHDIDKLFYEALEGNAEMPSAAAREKLIAALDKKDAESTRKGLIWWRRTALLLIVLLAGFVLFDTGILQTGNGPGNKKPVSEKSISAAMKCAGPTRRAPKSPPRIPIRICPLWLNPVFIGFYSLFIKASQS